MANPLPKRQRNGGKFPRKKSNRRNPETGRRETQLHPSITQKDRWVVTTPDLAGEQMVEKGLLDKSHLNAGRQVFLSEQRALSVAAGIANNHRVAVEVAHERQNEQGEWVEVEE